MNSFVIVSEEAISKGIRRIVALTGPEALKAEKKCHSLEQQVEKIQNLVQGKMKDGGLKIKETLQEIAGLTEERINTVGVIYTCLPSCPSPPLLGILLYHFPSQFANTGS